MNTLAYIQALQALRTPCPPADRDGNIYNAAIDACIATLANEMGVDPVEFATMHELENFGSFSLGNQSASTKPDISSPLIGRIDVADIDLFRVGHIENSAMSGGPTVDFGASPYVYVVEIKRYALDGDLMDQAGLPAGPLGGEHIEALTHLDRTAPIGTLDISQTLVLSNQEAMTSHMSVGFVEDGQTL